MAVPAGLFKTVLRLRKRLLIILSLTVSVLYEMTCTALTLLKMEHLLSLLTIKTFIKY